MRYESAVVRPELCDVVGPDVRADELGGQQQPGPALDVLPLDRVVRIARPDPIADLEDSEVGPRAAARAGLDLEGRMPVLQLGDQPVHREHLQVPARASVVGRLDEVAVVVPLDEVDAHLADDGVELPEDVSIGIRVRKIEDVLRAPRELGVVVEMTGVVQQPLGVGARDVGVERDHLGLEPQAELHAQVVHARGERHEPLGPHLAVDDPVAQARRVVAAPLEPAVIEHEALDPDLGRALGELQRAAPRRGRSTRPPTCSGPADEGMTDAAPALASTCGCARRGRRGPPG